MIQAEKDFRSLAARLWYDDSITGPDSRKICATQYNGAYGPAGWVLAINGSPPKGTFFIHAEGVHYIVMGRSHIRKLGAKDTAIVMRYVHYLDALKIAEGAEPADDSGI